MALQQVAANVDVALRLRRQAARRARQTRSAAEAPALVFRDDGALIDDRQPVPQTESSLPRLLSDIVHWLATRLVYVPLMFNTAGGRAAR
jgi:hypothetical protein